MQSKNVLTVYCPQGHWHKVRGASGSELFNCEHPLAVYALWRLKAVSDAPVESEAAFCLPR
jgi:hypothetical protein